ncbi:hypothetical protein N752_00645 [Desulforamulus aquiferis]|nr:UvrB/UvrC motif-containing protein [Desulforamulus aquiferis]RYD07123.1 hypothetical protein N752_00645 [Desulforamulus aquiferis]
MAKPKTGKLTKTELKKLIAKLEKEMKESARHLEFERAAKLRDALIELRLQLRGDKDIKPAIPEVVE